jgi:hypothetical protein
MTWFKHVPQMIPMNQSVLCIQCLTISDARGDNCPACGDRSLISLARLLNADPREGTITFLRAA